MYQQRVGRLGSALMASAMSIAGDSVAAGVAGVDAVALLLSSKQCLLILALGCSLSLLLVLLQTASMLLHQQQPADASPVGVQNVMHGPASW